MENRSKLSPKERAFVRALQNVCKLSQLGYKEVDPNPLIDLEPLSDEESVEVHPSVQRRIELIDSQRQAAKDICRLCRFCEPCLEFATRQGLRPPVVDLEEERQAARAQHPAGTGNVYFIDFGR